MMSATPPSTTDKKLLNLDEDQMASNQEAIPVPYARGHARLGLKWITDVLRRTTTQVKQKGGGKGASSAGGQYNYYGDLAGAIQLGRLSKVRAVLIDKAVVYEDPEGLELVADAVTQAQFAEYGEFFFYPGTTGQPADTYVLNVADGTSYQWDPELHPQEFESVGEFAESGWQSSQEATAVTHPAYPGVAYVAIRKLFFGEGRTSAPNVELITESVPDGVIGLPTDITEQGVNPVTCIAELLTDPFFGAGYSVGDLDAASFHATAQALARKPEWHYVSPLFTQISSVREMIARLCSYFDGWLRVEGGKVVIGYYPHDGVVPDVREISLRECVAKPKIEEQGWTTTINAVTVKHRDATRRLKESAETAASTFNFDALGEVREQQEERLFFVTRTQARLYASRMCNLLAYPLCSGTVEVRADKAVGLGGEPIRPGDRFQIDHTYYELDLVVRCTRRVERPRSGVVVLEWEQERGLFATQYQPAIDMPVVEVDPVSAIGRAVVLTVPGFLTGSVRTTAAVLAERPADAEYFHLWYAPGGATMPDGFDRIGSCQSWALAGSLHGNVPAPEPPPPVVDGEVSGRTGVVEEPYKPITVTISAGGTDIAMLEPQSDAAMEDNRLLMVIDQEIFSVGHVSVISPGVYQVSGLRERGGSEAAAHGAGSPVWIIRKDALLADIQQHQGFVKSDMVHHFKLQSARMGSVQPLEEALHITHMFPWRESALPVVFWDPGNPTTAETGYPIWIRGWIEDQNEDLTGWSMSSFLLGAEKVEAGGSVLPSGRIDFAIPVTFLQPGQARIRVTATDFENFTIGYTEAWWPATGWIEVTGENKTNQNLWDIQTRIQHAFDILAIREAELEEQANALADRIEQELLEWARQIELTNNRFGAEISRIETQLVDATGALASEVTRIGAASLNNAAAIAEEKQARVSALQAMSQRIDALVAELTIGIGRINGLASAVSVLQADVQRQGTTITANASDISRLKASVQGLLDGQSATATHISNLQASVQLLNGTLTAHASALHSLQVSSAADSAKVSQLSDAFIKDGVVQAGYRLRLDANGTVTGMEAIARNDPNAPPLSVIRFTANVFQVLVQNRLFELTLDQPVLQQLGGGTAGGDSTWVVRNAHIPIWLPTSGTWKGGSAEVKVYPADGK